jgi:hypothetical protein
MPNGTGIENCTLYETITVLYSSGTQMRILCMLKAARHHRCDARAQSPQVRPPGSARRSLFIHQITHLTYLQSKMFDICR